MLLNGAAQIEDTAMQFPQFALLHSATCVQLRLIRILGNCGCVAVASFLGVPSPLELAATVIGRYLTIFVKLMFSDKYKDLDF
jgi:hypothetical protein